MKKIPTLILLLHCAAIRAETLIGEVQWEYAYVDLHQACKRYYSLYPPSVKCIEDRLYKVQYKITYGFGDQVRRGDLDVWRFFYPPGTSGPIKLPPRSWRYFAQSKDEEGRRLREYRSALVLRIVADKQTHYWIEIESRNMEPGYRAIILGGIRSEHDQHIAGAMEIIASYQGRGMEGLSENLSVDKIKWGIYRHKYIKGTTPQALDSEHLLRFLGTYQT